jgi:hypothetical protein
MNQGGMKIIDTTLKHRQHHEWGWPTTWNVAESYQLWVVEVRDMTITLGRATNRNKCPGRPNSERDSLAFHTWSGMNGKQKWAPIVNATICWYWRTICLGYDRDAATPVYDDAVRLEYRTCSRPPIHLKSLRTMAQFTKNVWPNRENYF